MSSSVTLPIKDFVAHPTVHFDSPLDGATSLQLSEGAKKKLFDSWEQDAGSLAVVSNNG